MKHQMKTNLVKMTVECLLCGKGVDVGVNPKINDYITCKKCQSEWEIIYVDPVMIDWPFFDDDDDDFYDDIDDYWDAP